MVLNSHWLFFFLKPWNHTVFVSTRYHVWLFSGGFSLTVPSHQLQDAGVCAVAFYRVTESGETHKSYHSPLSPAMKLGTCLVFRRWIGCKEPWNSCWARSSPEKALPVQERRPDFESLEAVQSQVGEHASIIHSVLLGCTRSLHFWWRQGNFWTLLGQRVCHSHVCVQLCAYAHKYK